MISTTRLASTAARTSVTRVTLRNVTVLNRHVTLVTRITTDMPRKQHGATKADVGARTNSTQSTANSIYDCYPAKAHWQQVVSSVVWKRGVDVRTQLRIHAGEDQLHFRYGSNLQNGRCAEVDACIRLTWTPCHYGGRTSLVPLFSRRLRTSCCDPLWRQRLWLPCLPHVYVWDAARPCQKPRPRPCSKASSPTRWQRRHDTAFPTRPKGYALPDLHEVGDARLAR
jgi:hypothetical protein